MNQIRMQDLAQIFSDNRLTSTYLGLNAKSHEDRLERYDWFNAILDDMSVYAYNHIGFYPNKNYDLDQRPYLPEVDINNYAIVRVKKILQRMMLSIFPHDDMWSHPAAKYLMEQIVNGEMKKYLEERALISFWQPMKLFAHLCNAAMNSPSLNLNLANVPQFQVRSETVDGMIQNVVNTLGMRGSLVCVFKMHLIFTGEEVQYIREKLAQYQPPHTAYVGENLTLLNQACRQWRVDIVK